MKHGISPTTPRGQVYDRYVNVSKPLALAFLFRTKNEADPWPRDEHNRPVQKISYLPVWIEPKDWPTDRVPLGLRAAPVSNTFKRTEPKLTRPGLRRRAAARGEALSEERLGVRRSQFLKWPAGRWAEAA